MQVENVLAQVDTDQRDVAHDNLHGVREHLAGYGAARGRADHLINRAFRPPPTALGGSYMPKTKWLHYGGNRVAP